MKVAGVLFIIFGILLSGGAVLSVLGIPLIIIGILLCLTIVGAIVGIPLILVGLILMLAVSGPLAGIPLILIGLVLLLLPSGRRNRVENRSSSINFGSFKPTKFCAADRTDSWPDAPRYPATSGLSKEQLFRFLLLLVFGGVFIAAGIHSNPSNTERSAGLADQSVDPSQTHTTATTSAARAAPAATAASIPAAPEPATTAPDANIAVIQKARSVVSEWTASKTPPLTEDDTQKLLGDLHLAEADLSTPNVSANARAVVDQLNNLENDREALAKKEKAEQDAKCARDLDCMAQKAIPIAAVMCGPLIEKFAKYQYRWTQGFLQTGFTAASWVNRKKGIVTVGGDDIEFENGFGVWQPMSYACTVDVPNASVIHVKVVPGRLP